MTECVESAYKNYCATALFGLQNQPPRSYKRIELRHVSIYHFHENPFCFSWGKARIKSFWLVFQLGFLWVCWKSVEKQNKKGRKKISSQVVIKWAGFVNLVDLVYSFSCCDVCAISEQPAQVGREPDEVLQLLPLTGEFTGGGMDGLGCLKGTLGMTPAGAGWARAQGKD